MKKKILYLAVIGTIILSSCGSEAKTTAKEVCGTVGQLLTRAEKYLKIEDWYSKLSIEEQTDVYQIDHKTSIDPEKCKEWRSTRKESAELVNEINSFVRSINDKFGEKEGFMKEMRIELREICPEVAKKIGL
ncbi:MAG: hypothetical protein ACJAY9_001412 [Flavobacteriales bacterium]|jgi:hypothetical protein|tara:strand:+ start:5598 stop:5993 length:396 start_codon:yes stop_codon:yes gene_type:complete